MDGGGAPKGGVKISFILLGLCIVITIVCYGWGRWADAHAEQQQTPRLAVDSLVKSVRQYHKQTGQFPNNMADLEEKIWRHKTPPDFGPDKRRLTAFHYYYIYTKVDPLTCAVWAIPSGPKRETAPTIFLVVGVDVIRSWKGPSLAKADVDKLQPVPSNDLLNVLGMTEQPLVDQRPGAKPVR